jgi:hypothetical protein
MPLHFRDDLHGSLILYGRVAPAVEPSSFT